MCFKTTPWATKSGFIWQVVFYRRYKYIEMYAYVPTKVVLYDRWSLITVVLKHSVSELRDFTPLWHLAFQAREKCDVCTFKNISSTSPGEGRWITYVGVIVSRKSYYVRYCINWWNMINMFAMVNYVHHGELATTWMCSYFHNQ